MVAVAVGGFQDEQVAGVGWIGIRQDGRIDAAEVTGEDHSVFFRVLIGKGEENETGAEDVPGVFQLEGYSLFQVESLIQFEFP